MTGYDALAPVHGPAAALGVATFDGDELLDVWYPRPALGSTPPDVEGISEAIDTAGIRMLRTQTVVTVVADLQAPPADRADVWLRLHLLSHRVVRPRTVRCGSAPTAASTASASGPSWNDSLGTSMSAAVSATTSRDRSRGCMVTAPP